MLIVFPFNLKPESHKLKRVVHIDGTTIIYKAAGPGPLLLVKSFRLSFETSAHLIHYKSESRSGFGLPLKYKWIYRFFISFIKID